VRCLLAQLIWHQPPEVTAAASPAEGTSTRVRVVSIIDGDIVRAETANGHDLGRVRMLCIDAPEEAHGPEPAECSWTGQAGDADTQPAPDDATTPPEAPPQK